MEREYVASDGHRFRALVGAPTAARATLVFWPALGVRAAFYRGFVDALAAAGVRAIVPEWRGIDTSSLRPARGVDWGYHELLERDLPAVWAELPEDAPRLLGGHSLGGQLSVLYGSLTDAAGLVLVASCLPYHAAFEGFAGKRLRVAPSIMGAIGAIVGFFPGDRVGFGGREARTLMRDWGHSVRTGHYAPIGATRDWEATAAAYDRPVLAVEIAGDDWAPAAAIDVLLAKTPRAEQVRVVAPTAGRGHPHFAWARDSTAVVEEIARFIEALPTHGSPA